MRSDDTIFAMASGHGRAAVCLIRISGGESRFILERMAGRAQRLAGRSFSCCSLL